jgi:hypothetical protein
VYAKSLKLHRGVDNKLQFRFLNQEQKPVDITGKDITMRIINAEGTETLISKTLVPTIALNGIAEFRLSMTDLEDIDSQVGTYSLEIPVDSFDLPVFVDASSGARGVIEIVDSILPKVVPSLSVTIPSHAVSDGTTEVTFYSSTIQSAYKSTLTMQLFYENYTGTMTIQGTTDPNDNSSWYDLGLPYSYTAESDTQYYNITGFHPYLRFKFQYTEGDVTNILVR